MICMPSCLLLQALLYSIACAQAVWRLPFWTHSLDAFSFGSRAFLAGGGVPKHIDKRRVRHKLHRRIGAASLAVDVHALSSPIRSSTGESRALGLGLRCRGNSAGDQLAARHSARRQRLGHRVLHTTQLQSTKGGLWQYVLDALNPVRRVSSRTGFNS